MAEHVDLNGVKTTKSEHQVVVLIPQPSNDPKDPLVCLQPRSDREILKFTNACPQYFHSCHLNNKF